ncbi:MAG: ribonuclease P protein subunit [Methanoregulaceae archaeon]|nr:ribonuclease P protein subunit [Methanoregulaceae archaeon]
MISPQNVIRHELIGLDVLVIEATNRYIQGMKGIVVDETRNMVHILSAGKVRRIQKSGNMFRFTLPDGTMVDIQGKTIAMQPERRVAIRVKK